MKPWYLDHYNRNSISKDKETLKPKIEAKQPQIGDHIMKENSDVWGTPRSTKYEKFSVTGPWLSKTPIPVSEFKKELQLKSPA